MQQQDSSSAVDGVGELEDETNDGTRFEKSLKELRDLCSHLYQAADYCETSFLNSRRKRSVVEGTKEYIARAVVTVVDHLGSVSSNLECRLMETHVSEAEFRINSLKQRLGTWKHYSHLLALRSNSWNAHFPGHHPRYIILPPIQDPERTSNIIVSPMAMTMKSTPLLETVLEEEVPLFLCSTFDDSLERSKSFSTPVLPVRDGMSISPLRDQHPNFQFLQGSPKQKRGMLNWKPTQNKDLKWLIRRGKRTLTSTSAS